MYIYTISTFLPQALLLVDVNAYYQKVPMYLSVKVRQYVYLFFYLSLI